MGGDRVSSLISSADDDSSLGQEFEEYPFESPTLLRGDGLISKIDDDLANVDKGLGLPKLDDMGGQLSSYSLHFKVNQGRACSVYSEILSSYDELQYRAESLEEAKQKILRYNAGAWTEEVGGMKLSDYDIPKTTSLLLVGPERSGKSSLVNKISSVFDDDKFAPERAQVSYNPDVGDGTYFLQEYMVPRGSTSFCLYDTRSLSANASENSEILKHWMTEGVCHGELVSRTSDGPSLKTRMRCKAHQKGYSSSKIRKVNFVIFVVNGLAVLNSMDNDDEAEDGYNTMITTMFNCPFMSFRDDKPVVVITHGDLLRLSDRARVRVHLGKLLGVHPRKQIFDIPDNCDSATKLTIIDLLRYSLEHADKNLPGKGWLMGKVHTVPQPGLLLLALMFGIAIISALIRDVYLYSGRRHHSPETDSPIKWNANNAPQADNPVYVDSIHVPQTDIPTDTNTIHSRHTDTPIDSKEIHSPQTDTPENPSANHVPQKDTTVDWNSIRYLWLGLEVD